jgi:formylglycine-generating enzyme required for sulfatase activity
LAYEIQSAHANGDGARPPIALNDALDLLNHNDGEVLLEAGEALGVLEEDDSNSTLWFNHQLLQEYFAARILKDHSEDIPERVRREWRSMLVRPSLRRQLRELNPADSLGHLPQNGWEEVVLLAVAMTALPEIVVGGLIPSNLELAARCANESDIRRRISEPLITKLRISLVERTESRKADLRDRISCAFELGTLGDPRFLSHSGKVSDYIWPPFVEVPAGRYTVGGLRPIDWKVPGPVGATSDHIPRHEVEIQGTSIGRFPVTNREWCAFMTAEGYDDDRWWDGHFGRELKKGTLNCSIDKNDARVWRRYFTDDPDLLERMTMQRRFQSEEIIERWRSWMQLGEDDFENALEAYYVPRPITEPAYWRDSRFNHPQQPVVGVSWYEARAYCCWLATTSSRDVRLPTEVEWEAAGRGSRALRYPWGNRFDPARANTFETRIKRTAPVGVFPAGDSPCGASDMSGNVLEWTSTLTNSNDGRTQFVYPYDPMDGREDLTDSPLVGRVVRGGSWLGFRGGARVDCRRWFPPTNRSNNLGFRLICQC